MVTVERLVLERDAFGIGMWWKDMVRGQMDGEVLKRGDDKILMCMAG